MADDAEGSEHDGWYLLFGFGLLWTLVAGGIFSLITLASLGLIGTGNEGRAPPNILMFGVMLAMLSPGPAMLYAGGADRRALSREKALRARFPGQPWKWTEKWNSGVIPANAAAEAFWTWYGASALALFLAPAAVHLLILEPDWRALILLPFALVDGLLFRHAWRRTRSAQQYGKLGLQLAQWPLQPGGSFEALLKVPAALEGEAMLKLSCTHTVSRGHGKNRTSQRVTDFESTGCAAIVSSGAHSLIRVALALPAGPVGPAFTWTLEVSAPQLDESFELPVFAAAEVERRALA